MIECFKCGVSNEKALLFDAISKKGIVQVCNKCLSEENIPLIRKPETPSQKRPERRKTVYERLSHSAGVNIPAHKLPTEREKEQDSELRKIVDENLKENIDMSPIERPHLVDNFHWVIMRARRQKKISQEQLAKALFESEKVIELAEKGILPKDNSLLINKLENHLGIRLLRKDPHKEEEKEFIFDPFTTKTLTISELRQRENEKGKDIFEKPFKSPIPEEESKQSSEDKPEFEIIEEDLFKEEDDDLFR